MFVKGEVRTLRMVIPLDDDVVANPMMGIGIARAGSGLIDADRRIRIEIAIALIGFAEPGMNARRGTGQISLPDPVLIGDANIVARTQVGAKLLTHFFPPTENTDVAKNRIDEQSLRARVDSVQDGVARATLEGRLKMKHPFYHKDDDKFVEATMVGFVDFEPGKQSVKSFRLVTDKATYGQGTFAVAVKSVK